MFRVTRFGTLAIKTEAQVVGDAGAGGAIAPVEQLASGDYLDFAGAVAGREFKELTVTALYSASSPDQVHSFTKELKELQGSVNLLEREFIFDPGQTVKSHDILARLLDVQYESRFDSPLATTVTLIFRLLKPVWNGDAVSVTRTFDANDGVNGSATVDITLPNGLGAERVDDLVVTLDFTNFQTTANISLFGIDEVVLTEKQCIDIDYVANGSYTKVILDAGKKSAYLQHNVTGEKIPFYHGVSLNSEHRSGKWLSVMGSAFTHKVRINSNHIVANGTFDITWDYREAFV